jgi:hypothetical protein
VGAGVGTGVGAGVGTGVGVGVGTGVGTGVVGAGVGELVDAGTIPFFCQTRHRYHLPSFQSQLLHSSSAVSFFGDIGLAQCGHWSCGL